jgi:hypothetical protein
MVIASSFLSRSRSRSFSFSFSFSLPFSDVGPALGSPTCGVSDDDWSAAAATLGATLTSASSCVGAGTIVMGLSSSPAGLATAETSLRRTSLLREGIASPVSS